MIPPVHLKTLLFPDEFGFRKGLRSALAAVAFMGSRPRVIALCVAPWLINLFVVLPLSGLLVWGVVYPWLSGMLLPDGGGAWAEFFRTAAKVFFALPFLGLHLLVVLAATFILGAPFHDKVGETIEQELLAGRPELLAAETPKLQGIVHSVGEAVRRLAVVLPVFLAGFLFGLVPVVGALLAAGIQVTAASMFMTLDAFSMPMDRRNLKMRSKVRWLRQNWRFAVGFGLPFLAVPCAIFVTPPLAAVAASMLYCEHLLGNTAGTGGPGPATPGLGGLTRPETETPMASPTADPNRRKHPP